MYSAFVVKIEEVRKHSNADRLQVATIFGNNVIVGLDVKVGDVGLYFPTDGRLGKEFADRNNMVRKKDENGNNIGGYLDPEKRNIRALSLRGEKSDGLYMSLSALNSFTDISKLKVGDKINVLNGIVICEKYIPAPKTVNTQNKVKKKKKYKNQYPLFTEHVDTVQLAYNKNAFNEGDECTITLKLHGTSARVSNTIRQKDTILTKLLKKFGFVKNNYEYISGTRRVVLNDFKGGFYGTNEFRKKWHDYFIGKLHKNETVYFEIVGYTKEQQLIMPICDNKKTGDKEFIKKYGDKTKFTYGCEDGESDIYVYRMTMTNEDGYVVEYPTELARLRCEQMGVKHVPVLDKFTFTSIEDLDKRIDKHGDGVDPIGKTHIREGVIVRIENREKFTALKFKNWDFKLLEGIVKNDGILDIEEEQSII